MNENKLISLLAFSGTSIKHAMQKLSDTSEKILFVTDNNKILIGTVTDGDIRRGLLDGLDFCERIENVMNKIFFALPQNTVDLDEQAKKIMIEKKIDQIPIVDEMGKIVDAIIWTDLFDESKVEQRRIHTNKVVIMSGGKGTRLHPFTNILPKALIPIGEKPVIELIMERFSRKGFCDFIYTLNYKKEYIKAFLRETPHPFNVEWIEETDFTGTAGSLSLLKDKLKEAFFVCNCDSILNVDYEEVLEWHRQQNATLTIIGCHKEVTVPFGILEQSNGSLQKIVEKPIYDVTINTGAYVIEPSVVDIIPIGTHMDMNTLIEKVSKNGKVSVYHIKDGWFDIGQWEAYKVSVEKIGKFEGV